MRISVLQLGSPGTKNHLDVAPVESHRIYYKGEGGGFPQVRALVSLVCLSCLWLVLTPKVFQLRVSDWSLSFLPSPILKLQHAPLPLYSATSQGACPDSLFFHCFSLGLTFESLKELGARQTWGMYAVSIVTLFCLPCGFFHTKSTFEKGDFVEFWISMDWDNWIRPMLWIIEGITL